MAIRNLRYENDEILKKCSKEIEVIDERIKELAQDMIDTMHKWDGVGLAGPQVGVLKRIIVIDLYEALNLEGKKVKIKAQDLLAQALAHEIDHLNGIVFTEKVLPGTLETINKEKKD